MSPATFDLILFLTFIFSTFLIHETGHMLVAMHYRMKFIYLFFAIYISPAEQKKFTNRQLVMLFKGGPYASIIAGILFVIIAIALMFASNPVSIDGDMIYRLCGLEGPIAIAVALGDLMQRQEYSVIFFYLAITNGIISGFGNLLPIPGLDGDKVKQLSKST